jgi:hypothetical protein
MYRSGDIHEFSAAAIFVTSYPVKLAWDFLGFLGFCSGDLKHHSYQFSACI